MSEVVERLTPSPTYAGERAGERGERHRASKVVRFEKNRAANPPIACRTIARIAHLAPLPRPLPMSTRGEGGAVTSIESTRTRAATVSRADPALAGTPGHAASCVRAARRAKNIAAPCCAMRRDRQDVRPLLSHHPRALPTLSVVRDCDDNRARQNQKCAQTPEKRAKPFCGFSGLL